MFRIPNFYEMNDMSFDEAARIISGRANGDLLEGMKSMNRLWEDYCASDDQDDDEFFETWEYEVNAYNVVFENMSKLFAPAA